MFQHTAARRRLDVLELWQKHYRRFQHTAARRRLAAPNTDNKAAVLFQHTAARRRLVYPWFSIIKYEEFQHTAARRRLVKCGLTPLAAATVSTHSRPKAAGSNPKIFEIIQISFNTQPPEGGWDKPFQPVQLTVGFNTQPPEGGWLQFIWSMRVVVKFQHTAARRRLVLRDEVTEMTPEVSTHSRPKAAGFGFPKIVCLRVSFNTQPPEGGWGLFYGRSYERFSFNTQPPEGGWANCVFHFFTYCVSTHSRPKAAGEREIIGGVLMNSFNTQPPEGGWNSL